MKLVLRYCRILLPGTVFFLALACPINTQAAGCPAMVWWESVDGNGGDTPDYLNTLATDASGNVLVVGYDMPAWVMTGMMRKYNSLGDLLWARLCNDGAGNNAIPFRAKFLSGGGYVVVGWSKFSGSGDDAFVAKYDSSDNLVWSRTWSCRSGTYDDRAYAVDVDSSGTIYVGGFAGTTSGEDFMLLKYDSSGNLMGATQWDSGGSRSDQVKSVKVCPDGNVVFCGDGELVANNKNYYVWKRNASDFSEVWSYQKNFYGNHDYVYDGDVDGATGEIVAVGRAENWPAGTYWAIVKLDSSGNEMWTRTYQGTTAKLEEAMAVTITTGGVIYVVGTYFDSVTDNMMFRKYGPTGDLLDYFGYNGTFAYQGSARSLDIFPDGSLAMGGRVFKSGLETEWRVARYIIGNHSCFDSSAVINPSTVNAGGVFGVTLTVTNNGTDVVNTVVPSIAVITGSGLLSSPNGPYPASVASMGVGASQTFTWSYTATGGGTVGIRAVASGTDAFSGSPVVGTRTLSGSIIQPAQLVSTLTANPSSPVVGNHFTLTLQVANTGSATAFNVGALGSFIPGTTAFESLDVPLPLSYIYPGQSGYFTWTYSVSGVASAIFSTTATGTDGQSGYDTVAKKTRAVGSRTPPAVGISAVMSTTTGVAGEWRQVNVTVTNTGGSEALNMVVGLVTSPANALEIVSGDTGPAAIYDTPYTFVFTVSVSGTGEIQMSVTVSGVAEQTGKPVFAGTDLSFTGYRPPVLSSSWSVAPSPVVVGQWGEAVLRVDNNGDSALNGVVPVLDINSGGGAFVQQGTVSPTGLLSLSPGTSAFFTWTFSATGAGDVRLTGTASGSGEFTGNPFGTAASGVFPSISAASAIRVSCYQSIPGLKVGDQFEIRMSLSNTGGLSASALTGTMFISDYAKVQVVSAPSPIASLAPGAAAQMAWTLKALKAGNLSFTLTVTGTSGTAELVAVAGLSSSIAPAPASGLGISRLEVPVGVYPNPPRGDTLNVAIQLEKQASEVEIEVHNSGYRRIYRGTWRDVSLADGGLVLSGIKSWAPGVYFLKVRVTYVDGTRKVFSPVRVVIKR